jgi:2,3-bisphosphoglycerate-independent phosphoglycerate mutase
VRKTIIIHVDGLPGYSFPELNNQTVLQAARTPCLDQLAAHGESGRLGVPGKLHRFSGEMTLLALLGYDPNKWYTGPGPFEGVSQEVVLDAQDVAFLCQLVTLRGQDGWGDGKKLGSQLFMADPFGGGVETEDAREFIDAINEQLVSESIQFYIGHQHRHLMVWVGGSGKVICRNPQEALGKPIDAYLPTGDGANIVREMMEASRLILNHHPVNQERLNAGLKPANCLWLWGPGKALELPPLRERWSIKGTVISPDGPYAGVGMAVGLQTVKVATVGEGDIAWLQALSKITSTVLETQELVCLHLPFYSWLVKDGQATPPSDLVEYLQRADEHVIGALLHASGTKDSHRIMVVCTPFPDQQDDGTLALSPYLMVEGQKVKSELPTPAFNEREMTKRPLRDATKLFERLVVDH